MDHYTAQTGNQIVEELNFFETKSWRKGQKVNPHIFYEKKRAEHFLNQFYRHLPSEKRKKIIWIEHDLFEVHPDFVVDTKFISNIIHNRWILRGLAYEEDWKQEKG